jgi:hypothetical protein
MRFDDAGEVVDGVIAVEDANRNLGPPIEITDPAKPLSPFFGETGWPQGRVRGGSIAPHARGKQGAVPALVTRHPSHVLKATLSPIRRIEEKVCLASY